MGKKKKKFAYWDIVQLHNIYSLHKLCIKYVGLGMHNQK